MSTGDITRDTLKDLNPEELRIFAQLLRVLMQSDSDFSQAEREHIERLDEQIEGGLWEILDEVAQSQESNEQIVSKAIHVGDQDFHEIIYGALYELSIVDGTDAGENQVLGELAEGWNLEIKDLPAS